MYHDIRDLGAGRVDQLHKKINRWILLTKELRSEEGVWTIVATSQEIERDPLTSSTDRIAIDLHLYPTMPDNETLKLEHTKIKTGRTQSQSSS